MFWLPDIFRLEKQSGEILKLIDAISKTRGQEHGRVRHLHGTQFYNAWDDIYGLFDVELLQLGRYAQSIQNSETENNMVSRIATTIPEKRKAQTSGFLIQFSPEKNGAGRRHTPFDITSSTPHLLVPVAQHIVGCPESVVPIPLNGLKRNADGISAEVAGRKRGSGSMGNVPKYSGPAYPCIIPS